jgi:hypothetical protein
MVSPLVAEAGQLNVLNSVRSVRRLCAFYTYTRTGKVVFRAQLGPGEVVLGLPLHRAEVAEALIALFSFVSPFPLMGVL